MTCTATYSSARTKGTLRIIGSAPKKPGRWSVQITATTPAGATKVLHFNTVQPCMLEDLDAVIDRQLEDLAGEIQAETGDRIASSVQWRASLICGKRRNEKRK